MKTIILLFACLPIFAQAHLTKTEADTVTLTLSPEERIELLKTERAFLEAANIAEAKIIDVQNALAACESCVKAQKAANDAQTQFQQVNQKFVAAKEAAEKRLDCKLDRDYVCIPKAAAPQTKDK